MREAILQWLLGGDAKSWKEMLRIATESTESCRKILKREEYLIERYEVFIDRENDILDAIVNSNDLQLKLKVVDILTKYREDGGNTNEIIR